MYCIVIVCGRPYYWQICLYDKCQNINYTSLLKLLLKHGMGNKYINTHLSINTNITLVTAWALFSIHIFYMIKIHPLNTHSPGMTNVSIKL